MKQGHDQTRPTEESSVAYGPWHQEHLARLESIPAILTEGNPIEISLIENLQRENLKPVEEAEALNKMIKEFSYTQEQLAHVIGKARSTVTEILSLNKLPDPVKDECRRTDISRRILIEVSKQETPEKMTALFEKVKTDNLTGESVRKISRKDGDMKRKTPAGIAIDKTQKLYLTLSNLILQPYRMKNAKYWHRNFDTYGRHWTMFHFDFDVPTKYFFKKYECI